MKHGKHAKRGVDDIHRDYVDACLGADLARELRLITVWEKRLVEGAAKAIRDAELIERQREEAT